MKNGKNKNLLKLIPAIILVLAIVITCLPNAKSNDVASGEATAGINVHAEELNIDFTQFEPITEHKEKTIMVYMVGSNLESGTNINGRGYASADLFEMMDSNVDIDKCNIVVMTGGAYNWQVNISSGNNLLLMVDNNGRNEFANINLFSEYFDMADPTTLEFFLSYSYYMFPADEYDLILWDHGGALTGFGDDEISQNFMGISGIADAFRKSPFNSSNKLGWILFSACLMAGLETASLLKDYSNYMIASEEVLWAIMFDYTRLGEVANNDLNGTEVAKILGDSTYNEYVRLANEGAWEFYHDYTLSCMELSKISAVENNLEALSRKAISRIDSYFNEYSIYRCNLLEYGLEEVDTDTIDLMAFAEFWEKYYPDEAGVLKDSIDETVTYNISEKPISRGISIYNTYSAIEEGYNFELASRIYEFDGICPDYLKFMKEFRKIYDSGSDVDWHSQNDTESTTEKTTEAPTETTTVITTQSTTESGTHTTTDTTTTSFSEGITRITRETTEGRQTTRGTTNTTSAPTMVSTTVQSTTENNQTNNNSLPAHDVEYHLSDEQAGAVAIVYKMVLTELGGYGGYTCSYQSTDVNIEGNRITADFDGYIYALESNGQKMALNLYEIQKVGNDRIFEAQVLACRTERFDYAYAAPFCLRIIFNGDNPNGKITGMRPLNIERGYAPVEIKDGYSFMSMNTGFKGITYDKNNHIKPLGQWEEAYPATSSNTLTVKNGLSLTKTDISNESNCFMCLYIRDTHGYAFMTELVDLKKK